MTYEEIIMTVLSRVDEDVEDQDPDILPVIKNAINQAYLILRTQVDQRTEVIELPYTVPVVLPSTVGDVIDVVHSKDGRIGVMEYTKATDSLYIFSPLSQGELSIRHVAIPELLINPDDITELKPLLNPALVAYGAYAYQLYRRKYASAQLLLAEFEGYTGQRTQAMPEEGEN